jgi:hypothetical protein
MHLEDVGSVRPGKMMFRARITIDESNNLRGLDRLGRQTVDIRLNKRCVNEICSVLGVLRLIYQ